MEHYSPLPLSLLISVFGALISATLTYHAVGSLWLALLAYSLGGAVTLIASVTILCYAPIRRRITA